MSRGFRDFFENFLKNDTAVGISRIKRRKIIKGEDVPEVPPMFSPVDDHDSLGDRDIFQ